MQMSKDKKPWNIWEYLGMGENTSGNFGEFLGIPNNSKFGGNCLWNLWELLGIAKTPMRINGNSQEFSINPKILKSLLTWKHWCVQS